MKLLWSAAAWDDYLYWQETDQNIARRINVLLRDISRNPFKGIGKPEPLRGDLSGWLSRRGTGDIALCTALAVLRPANRNHCLPIPVFWSPLICCEILISACFFRASMVT